MPVDSPPSEGEKEALLSSDLAPGQTFGDSEEYIEALRLARRQTRRKRRLCHFFFISLLFSIWVISRRWSNKPVFPKLGCGQQQPIEETPIPAGITVEKCTNWDGQDDVTVYPSVSNSTLNSNGARQMIGHTVFSYAQFSLPIDNDNHDNNRLFFMSRGSFSAGHFQTVQSEERVGDTAKVTVVMGYQDERFFDLTRVCRISRVGAGDGEVQMGLGIFTPHWAISRPFRKSYSPTFVVILEWPQARTQGGERFVIPGIEQDMPLFEW